MEYALVAPTPQTNLSCLHAHQQPGVRGEGNQPSQGQMGKPEHCHCSVQGIR